MLGFQGGVSIPLVKGGVKAPPAKRQCRAGPKAVARRGFTFEGEPARPISVRRLKQSPLRDVAGMLRSFHYAVATTLLEQTADIRPEDLATFEPWARVWYRWVSVAFLQAYCAVAGQGTFLPQGQEERQVLLDAYLLEKVLYELRYELNSRPDWV